jgi:hypothetical protein
MGMPQRAWEVRGEEEGDELKQSNSVQKAVTAGRRA